MISSENSREVISANYAGSLNSQLLNAILLGFLTALAIAGGIAIVRGNVDAVTIDADTLGDGASPIIPAQEELTFGLTHLPLPKSTDTRAYVAEGFEDDLLRELAKRLGMAIKTILVSPDKQLAALNERKVDAILTRIDDENPLRTTTQILPTGYQSGLSPVMHSDHPLGKWSELSGHTVCVTTTNIRGQKIARSLGATIRTTEAPAQALMDLRTGKCIATIHDRASLNPLFTKRFWQKFSATLPPIDPTSLVVAVAKGRADLAARIKRALNSAGTAEQWRHRQNRWAELVSFEVYRDQVAADCH